MLAQPPYLHMPVSPNVAQKLLWGGSVQACGGAGVGRGGTGHAAPHGGHRAAHPQRWRWMWRTSSNAAGHWAAVPPVTRTRGGSARRSRVSKLNNIQMGRGALGSNAGGVQVLVQVNTPPPPLTGAQPAFSERRPARRASSVCPPAGP